MPIEIECYGCRTRLRVADAAAGKSTKCPKCSLVISVPMASTPAYNSALDRNPFGNDIQDPNPYAPRHSSPPVFASHSTLGTGIIDPSLAVSISWQQFKKYAGVLIGAFVILMTIGFLINIFLAVAMAVTANSVRDPNSPILVFQNIGGTIFNQFVQFFLAIGFLKIALQAARDQPPMLGLLFSGGAQFLRYVGGMIIFTLMVMGGLILLIIPGIYVALTYGSFMYFIVDRNSGVLESFQLAKSHATGNRLHFFVLGFMAFGLGLLGVLSCGVGILVAGPVINVMFAVAWLMMTSQPHANIGQALPAQRS